MADMMGALLQLHFVKDPDLPTGDGQTMVGRINALMKDIELDIKKCGSLVDVYHRHSLTSMWTSCRMKRVVHFCLLFRPLRIGKFFFSSQYETDFKEAAEGLTVSLPSSRFCWLCAH